MLLTLNLSRYLILDLAESYTSFHEWNIAKNLIFFFSHGSFLKPMLVRKPIWGNSYIEVRELLGFEPFCHLLCLTLVWHMHEYAGSATLLFCLCPVQCCLWKVIHRKVLWMLFRCWCNSYLPPRKSKKWWCSYFSYRFVCGKLFIPRACQRVLPPDSSGEVGGVFVAVLWVFYSRVLVFSCLRRIFQGLSYFAIPVCGFYLKKINEIVSCVASDRAF